MRRRPHENVLTVLVDPAVLHDLELDLAGRDLWLWPVSTAGVYADGRQAAHVIRRRLVEARRGAWDVAAGWVPAWVAFGETWRHGDEPLAWAAHATLYDVLSPFASHVRYRRGLGGVPRLPVGREA
ncbi:hypothetical protein INN71_17775 [Nocardioides sp. ChNu-153]|uniref:hypothetical protein n=1 Tax=unclassified Nocardioides TaxID=2615069 RepID=UPI002404F6DB|nr:MULTISPECIES: hypothetical protein [unclassified Nocardioides]MDF9717653.1 hypothetical protein [Nocardioides sp. ChNu-99]MDN7123234.1 hypothetical protein [Nocardioides sp. ChNu-153]